MGGQMIASLEDKEREEAVVKEVAEVLETVVTREDGSEWLGYVRLRDIATRPVWKMSRKPFLDVIYANGVA